MEDTETGIKLTGAADAIFVRSNGSYLIADYKTSKYTQGQHWLRPTYDGQLNAYAWIGERTGWKPVTALALIYMEPLTAESDAGDPANHRDHGFALSFTPHVEMVEVQPDLIPTLLRKARKLYDQPSPPRSRRGCKDCEKFAKILSLLR